VIDSPTVPNRRIDDRSWASGYSAPHFINERIAVGEV